MTPPIDRPGKRDFREQNGHEYGDRYDFIRWPTSAQTREGTAERNSLLGELIRSGAVLRCHDTKLAYGELSPGCRCCTEGTWSCLFINNLCNGRCFFCPAPQSERDLPTTNGLTFIAPGDYADYIARFGFRGVSISGGEPLLDFARTLDFLSAVRARGDEAVHLWLYTNGIILKEHHLRALQAAGLDEIRFNLAATDYRLDKVKAAVAHIPLVTVEIPAIPEDCERLKEVVAELREIGVGGLNLHQLRLTPYNFEQLHRRPYTFLPGPRVTVLESELTALRIMNHNLATGIDLPINYCSFPYKHRYQAAASRRRAAALIRKPWEEITETGLIRSLALAGRSGDLKALAGILRPDRTGERWSLKGAGERLSFHSDIWPPGIWPGFAARKYSLVIRYEEAALRPAVSYGYPFRKIALNENLSLYAEHRPVTEEIVLGGSAPASFARRYLGKNGGAGGGILTDIPEGNDIDLPDGEVPWTKIGACEGIAAGLADYY